MLHLPGQLSMFVSVQCIVSHQARLVVPLLLASSASHQRSISYAALLKRGHGLRRSDTLPPVGSSPDNF